MKQSLKNDDSTSFKSLRPLLVELPFSFSRTKMKAQTNIISSPTPNPSSSYMLKSKLNFTFKSSLKLRFASNGFHELSHRTAHLKVVKLQKHKNRKPEQQICQTKQSWVANSKIQNESMKQPVLKAKRIITA